MLLHFLCIVFLKLFVNSQSTAVQLSQIYKEVFNSTPPYDKLTRPNDGPKPTEVACQYRINSVTNVSPKFNQFTVDLFLRLIWNDPRLKFPYDIGDETLQLDPEDVWKPDIYFQNEADFMEQFEWVLKINGKGDVFWSRHFILPLTSPFDMHDFPFDSQTLNFVLVSFTNNDNILNLSYFQNGPVYPPLKNTFNAALWDLDYDSPGVDTKYHSHEEGSASFDKLTYHLMITRQYNIYILKYVLPLMLVALSSCIISWLDPYYVGVRIRATMAFMMATIYLKIIIQEDLPDVNYSTNLDNFMAAMILFDFITLLQSLVLHYCYTHKYTILYTKIDEGFRPWAPLSVLHSTGLLLRRGPVTNWLSMFILISGILITIGIVIFTTISYRRAVEEANDSKEE